MPKLKKRDYAQMVIAFEGYRMEQKIPRSDVANQICVSETTYRRKLQSPEKFTVKELCSIGRFLGIPVEELRGFIKY